MHQRAPFTTEKLTLKSLTAETGLERFDKALSGRWKCRLSVVTPLCIKTSFEQQRRWKIERPFIPATSIRGMIRNTAQILGAGCGRLYGPDWEVPRHLAPCSPPNACVVCRIFGFAEKVEKVEKQDTWQSKVRFFDALTLEKTEWVLLNTDDRSGWGGGEPVVAAGWALFPHLKENLPRGSTPCIEKGSIFEFDVEYLNLDAEELAVLRLAITLKSAGPPLVHKIGFAKSLGLGSCLISIINDAPIKDLIRQTEIERQTARYIAMPGFQAITRWREAK